MKGGTELPYRRCVGAAIFNDAGMVWLGRRIAPSGSELEKSRHRWQMPQGGIDRGETPVAAARREIYEETGIASLVRLGEMPHWVNYNLPGHLVGMALKGRYRGQTQMWIAFRFTGEDEEIRINPPPDGHRAEFDDWMWARLDDVLERVVDFKRPVYEEVLREFEKYSDPRLERR